MKVYNKKILWDITEQAKTIKHSMEHPRNSSTTWNKLQAHKT